MIGIKGKRGEEEIQKIILTFFAAMMLLFSTVLLYNFITTIDVTSTFKLTSMQFNNVASRVIYSPKCFAYEEKYELQKGAVSEERFKVSAGVLDKSKINRARLDSCVVGTEYGISVRELDDEVNARELYKDSVIALPYDPKLEALKGIVIIQFDKFGEKEKVFIHAREFSERISGLPGGKKVSDGCDSKFWERKDHFYVMLIDPLTGDRSPGSAVICINGRN